VNKLDFQIVSQSKLLPEESLLQTWVDAVLTDNAQESEIVIRIVDEDEMTTFNKNYRKKEGLTNILSFPYEVPEGFNSPLLGDLLVCAPVVEQEALMQNKKLEHHWAHMIIHGVLHLLGYDHISNKEADEMEALEIKILNTIKIKNPYQEINKQ